MPAKTQKALASRIGEFLRLYGRKAQRGVEPNDRLYDRNIEKQLKRMKATEVSALISGNDDDEEH